MTSHLENLAQKALSHMELKQFAEALAAFNGITLEDPSRMDLCLGKALCLIGLGKPFEALPLLKLYINYYPEHSFASVLLDDLKRQISTDDPICQIDIGHLRNNFEYKDSVRLEDYLANNPNQIITAIPASENLPDSQIRIFTPTDMIVAGTDSVIFSKNGEIIRESTFYSNLDVALRSLYSNKITLYTSDIIKGEYLVLSGIWMEGFWHWMMEYLPALVIALHSGFTGKVLIKPNVPSFIRESLELLGIPPERIIEYDGNPVLIEKLIVPEKILAGIYFHKYPRLLEVFRHSVLSKMDVSTNKKRRIYISRSDASNGRKVINELALIELLKKYDFEIHTIGQLSLKEQIQIVSESNALVGPHGAGMAHTTFMQPKSLSFLHLAI